MIDKLKIVAQTLRGIGQHEEGEIVDKGVRLLERTTAQESLIKTLKEGHAYLEEELKRWKARAEAAEAALLKMKSGGKK